MKISCPSAILQTPTWAHLLSVSYECYLRSPTLSWSSPVLGEPSWSPTRFSELWDLIFSLTSQHVLFTNTLEQVTWLCAGSFCSVLIRTPWLKVTETQAKQVEAKEEVYWLQEAWFRHSPCPAPLPLSASWLPCLILCTDFFHTVGSGTTIHSSQVSPQRIKRGQALLTGPKFKMPQEILWWTPSLGNMSTPWWHILSRKIVLQEKIKGKIIDIHHRLRAESSLSHFIPSQISLMPYVSGKHLP